MLDAIIEENKTTRPSHQTLTGLSFVMLEFPRTPLSIRTFYMEKILRLPYRLAILEINT